MQNYNSKVILFDNRIEIIKYGGNMQRAPNEKDESNNHARMDIDDEEYKERQAMEQAYRIKRKIKYYCLANNFDLFWTLTLNDKKVNAMNYEYSRKRLQSWLKYMRETYGRFGFLFVPELHKSGRIHFHGVTQGFSPPLIEARYPNNKRLIKKNGIQIYNAPKWKNGFSTVSMIQDREKASSYITKYITKDLIRTPSAYHQPRYFVSRGLKQPEITYEDLPDEYFESFLPSFVVGRKESLGEPFEKEVSIYQIDITEDGEMMQLQPPETLYKLKQEKSSDGNQSFQ